MLLTKRIDGKLIVARPKPAFTDHAPCDMPFIDTLISVHNKTKNTLIHIFTSKCCSNTIFIGEGTPHVGKWSWYCTTVSNATPILQSSI